MMDICTRCKVYRVVYSSQPGAGAGAGWGGAGRGVTTLCHHRPSHQGTVLYLHHRRTTRASNEGSRRFHMTLF